MRTPSVGLGVNQLPGFFHKILYFFRKIIFPFERVQKEYRFGLCIFWFRVDVVKFGMGHCVVAVASHPPTVRDVFRTHTKYTGIQYVITRCALQSSLVGRLGPCWLLLLSVVAIDLLPPSRSFAFQIVQPAKHPSNLLVTAEELGLLTLGQRQRKDIYPTVQFAKTTVEVGVICISARCFTVLHDPLNFEYRSWYRHLREYHQTAVELHGSLAERELTSCVPQWFIISFFTTFISTWEVTGRLSCWR